MPTREELLKNLEYARSLMERYAELVEEYENLVAQKKELKVILPQDFYLSFNFDANEYEYVTVQTPFGVQQERRVKQPRTDFESHLSKGKTALYSIAITLSSWFAMYILAYIPALSAILNTLPFPIDIVGVVIGLFISFITISILNKAVDKRNKEREEYNRSLETAREEKKKKAQKERLDSYQQEAAETERYNIQAQKHNALVEPKIKAVESEIASVYDTYMRIVKPWYPPDYCNFEAINYFIHLVRNFRADTLKEAINLYVQDGLQLASIQNQRAMLEQLEDIRYNLRSIANTHNQILEQQRIIGERQKELLYQAEIGNIYSANILFQTMIHNIRY